MIWWNLETKEPIRSVKAHELWIRRLALSPDSRTLASVADDMQCKLWNAQTGEFLRQVSDHKPITPHDFPSMLYAVAFSADNRRLAAGGIGTIENIDHLGGPSHIETIDC